MDELSSTFANADPFQSWWPFIIAIVFGIVMTIRSIMGGLVCPSTNRINGQIVIVTGASGGIGLEITKELCNRGAYVIMACKDMVKGDESMKLIKKKHTEATVECRHLDLKSFVNIRKFVQSIEKDFQKIDILINNAGVIFNPEEKTIDNFEMHMQVNYLGPFLLTNQLMPMLNKSQICRIINTSAHAYSSGKMTEEDPLNIGTWATAYHHRDAFARSKLAVILSTRYLAKLLKDSTVTINVYTPGFVRGTDHLRRSPVMNAITAKIMAYPWMWIFMKNATQAAQTAIYLATEPKLQKVSGEYFNDCEKIDVSALATDDKLAECLFTETMKALKLNNKNGF